ncbi:carboxypeptidase regulatory-like domain-containing protein [Paenibacillus wenxiniae]|uniref:Carboxypeptidase regulatory-like domain-containing protein n=1 Tax=Paenibacillus wenxiniae TaxID=1636843 RepID=A0ABW4RIH6_9BACL
MKLKFVGMAALALSIGIAGISPSALAQSSSGTAAFPKNQPLNPLSTHVQSATVHNSKSTPAQNIPLSNRSAARSLAAVTATDSTYGSNTSPDTAELISANTTIPGYIDQQGGARWYYINVTSSLKLTAFLSTGTSNVDYDLTLYRLNPTTSTLEQVSYSAKGAGQYELLSHLATSGYYFISVTSYQGADTTNPFTLFTTLSDSYDQNEPDDNPFFAKDRGTAPFISQQNIDNLLDEDWTKITLNAQSKVNLRLNNTSANGSYVIQLWNANLQNLGSLTQNTDGQITLPAGSYYIQVYAPSTFDISTPYTLSVNYQSAAITRVAISEITSDRGVQGFIDYGYGKKWRIGYNIVVKGRAFDATGNPIGNGIVTVGVQTRVGNKTVVVNGNTDSLGYFSIPMDIGPAAGQYTYRGPVSTHYFDIIPIVFLSNNKQLNADINSLYHYAYSIN